MSVARASPRLPRPGRGARGAAAVLAVVVAGAGAGGCRDAGRRPRCLDAAAHAAHLSAATLGPLAVAPTTRGELGRVLAARCEADAWAPAVIQCVHTAASERALRACRERLPAPAQRALDAAVRAALGMRP